MSTRSHHFLVRLALLLVATFAGGASQAVVYTGHWDPLYVTPPFANLGWTASAVFNVPDSCLAQADGSYRISGACGGFGFQSASVSFYSALDSSQTVLETFQLSGVSSVNVTGIAITGGRVSGLATSFFDDFVPDARGAAAAIDGAGAYSFSLILLGGRRAQLYFASPVDASPGCADNFVENTFCGKSLNQGIGVFAPIPEPTSAALMVGGLGVLGVAARRRRRQAGVASAPSAA